MTTIAYKDGIMAADSKITSGDDYMGRCNKVVRLPYGHLLGMSGDADERDFVELLSKVRSVKNLPTRAILVTLKQAIRGLLVLKSGHVFYVEVYYDENAPDGDTAYTAQIIECHERCAAMGNGFRYALGAMEAGASAERAVHVACKYDTATGLPVKVYKLHDEKAEPKLKVVA